MSKLQYIQIGIVRKTFGTEGYLKIQPLEGFESAFDGLQHLFIKKSGQYLPYFIDDIDFEDDIRIKFDEIDKPEDTKDIVNLEIYVNNLQIDFSNFKKEILKTGVTGFKVIQNNKEIGIIAYLEEFPSQVMAAVNGPNTSFLLPLVDEFILDMDFVNKILTVDLPEGFLELNSE